MRTGAQSGCILAGDDATEERALELARGFTGLQGLDLAQEVTTDKIYEWRSAPWQLITDSHPEIQAGQLPYHVVVYDYGVKRNILRVLVARGCRLTVVPAQTPASEVLALILMGFSSPMAQVIQSLVIMPSLRLKKS